MKLAKYVPKYFYHVTTRRATSPLNHSIQYYLKNDQDRQISAWSQVPINLKDDMVSVVTQIPKQYTAKLQLIKEKPHHPIMQDTRKNKFNGQTQLRHYAIPLPLINYGFIPMTWQQNITKDENGMLGDDDPIDTIDLTTEKTRKILDVSELKVLGSFCLIDEGELDWKVFVMDRQEANNSNIDSISDIPPARIQQILHWFKIYKTFDGKPQNTIGFDGTIFGKYDTLQTIFKTHREFLKLKEGREYEYAKRKEIYNL